MKSKKISISLLVLVFMFLTTFNVYKSIDTSREVGFVSISDIRHIAFASTESGGADGNCKGSKCDDANGNKYNYLETGGIHYCCGVTWISRGKKKK